MNKYSERLRRPTGPLNSQTTSIIENYSANSVSALKKSRNIYLYVMPRRIAIQPLKEFFRANVLAMLKKEVLIDDDFIRMIIKWRHNSGFSVHNKVRIARDDNKGFSAFSRGKMRQGGRLCWKMKNLARSLEFVPEKVI